MTMTLGLVDRVGKKDPEKIDVHKRKRAAPAIWHLAATRVSRYQICLTALARPRCWAPVALPEVPGSPDGRGGAAHAFAASGLRPFGQTLGILPGWVFGSWTSMGTSSLNLRLAIAGLQLSAEQNTLGASSREERRPTRGRYHWRLPPGRCPPPATIWIQRYDQHRRISDPWNAMRRHPQRNFRDSRVLAGTASAVRASAGQNEL